MWRSCSQSGMCAMPVPTAVNWRRLPGHSALRCSPLCLIARPARSSWLVAIPVPHSHHSAGQLGFRNIEVVHDVAHAGILIARARSCFSMTRRGRSRV